MTEREITEPPYRKTNDYAVADKPLYWQRGVFRIRVYEKLGAVPIVVVAPTSPQPEQAVINVTPYLAADILGRHFTHRLWDVEPMRWIEEAVVRSRKKRCQEVTEREYWQVTFRSFKPRAVTVHGEVVLQLDERGRRRLKIDDVEKMLDCQLD